MDSQLAPLFLAFSENKLVQMKTFVDSCLSKLSTDQIWTRGAAHENSIGNLILHLNGNARQWIVAGVGGAPDTRNRDQEFSADRTLNREELLAQFHETVDEAIAILRTITPQRLAETIDPQHGPVSVLAAIYQVVGHFQQHVGQIIFATKNFAAQDLALPRTR